MMQGYFYTGVVSLIVGGKELPLMVQSVSDYGDNHFRFCAVHRSNSVLIFRDFDSSVIIRKFDRIYLFDIDLVDQESFYEEKMYGFKPNEKFVQTKLVIDAKLISEEPDNIERLIRKKKLESLLCEEYNGGDIKAQNMRNANLKG